MLGYVIGLLVKKKLFIGLTASSWFFVVFVLNLFISESMHALFQATLIFKHLNIWFTVAQPQRERIE